MMEAEQQKNMDVFCASISKGDIENVRKLLPTVESIIDQTGKMQIPRIFPPSLGIVQRPPLFIALSLSNPCLRLTPNQSQEVGVEILQCLLQAKADPNILVNDKPLLHHAIELILPKVVKVLLDWKANPNNTSEQGNALHVLAQVIQSYYPSSISRYYKPRLGQELTLMIQALIIQGVDPTTRNNRGMTPLEICPALTDIIQETENHLAITRERYNFHSGPNQKDCTKLLDWSFLTNQQQDNLVWLLSNQQCSLFRLPLEIRTIILNFAELPKSLTLHEFPTNFQSSVTDLKPGR